VWSSGVVSRWILSSTNAACQIFPCRCGSRHPWLKSWKMAHRVTSTSKTADAAKTTLSFLMFQYVSVGMGIAGNAPAPGALADYKEGVHRTQAGPRRPHIAVIGPWESPQIR